MHGQAQRAAAPGSSQQALVTHLVEQRMQLLLQLQRRVIQRRIQSLADIAAEQRLISLVQDRQDCLRTW